MSSSKKFADVAAVSLAVVGTVAIVAALAVGLTGWPPTRAAAAPAIVQGGIGIGDRTSGPVLIDTPSEDKIAVETTLVAMAALAKATPKAIAPLPVAKKRTAASESVHVRRTGKRYPAARMTGGFRTARVSWYGPGFYGHTMAGGGRLTPSSMVVASRSLPFGTRILFSYHGRSVVAVVRDRGPYVSGRMFDLGPGTAKALGFSGVAMVNYRIL